MLHESEEQEMDTYAVELNSFVDTVLTKVYDHTSIHPRNIIFSSFNPDICLLLSFKQPSIPVLFLTDAGTFYSPFPNPCSLPPPSPLPHLLIPLIQAPPPSATSALPASKKPSASPVAGTYLASSPPLNPSSLPPASSKSSKRWGSCV